MRERMVGEGCLDRVKDWWLDGEMSGWLGGVIVGGGVDG